MKALTIGLFKTTVSSFVIAILFLMIALYEEKQRNTDLYEQVVSFHKNVIDITTERQMCSHRIDVVELPLFGKVGKKERDLRFRDNMINFFTEKTIRRNQTMAY